MPIDPTRTMEQMDTYRGKANVWNLRKLSEQGYDVSRLPYAIRVLLEDMLRNYDGYVVRAEDAEAVAKWRENVGREIPYMPSRVVLQDFTGVPAVADIAAMREALRDMGGNPALANPTIPADLVIDHSVQVDYFGSVDAIVQNMRLEMERNRERYTFLRWAQDAMRNFRVVPPGRGIIHQVNVEYLAQVVHVRRQGRALAAFPDTLIGTDSHTTMAAGVGVLAWGVGGIEAEAAMLGQPYYIPIPEVVGVKLVGELPEGATATDLVLTVTEILRKSDVVGKIVEFFGPGVEKLPVPDRATVANMAPEYGATTGFFPIDAATLSYLRLTGKSEKHVKFVEEYAKRVGLFREPGAPDPEYSRVIEIDMSKVEPSIAGPANPEDRIPLRSVKLKFSEILDKYLETAKQVPRDARVQVDIGGVRGEIGHGFVALAAITSCTNTSNPYLMVGAALLAKKAVERGLSVKPWVKTSFAPGSRVVVEYLRRAGLMPYLEALRFHLTGFGCTVCIGNSGPLIREVEGAIKSNGLYAVSVLSGNRNFEGRINPLTRGSFLASPPLVVAYALAGRLDIDFYNEPLGFDPNGRPVYLRDIWPSAAEVREIVERYVDPKEFREVYSGVFEGEEDWKSLPAPSSTIYQWDPNSTYLKRPPFFDGMPLEPKKPGDIVNARVLVLLGDRITTDHISPAGSIPPDSPAGRYLIEHGVKPEDFNTYGSRRGNHEVMVRGTFANVRLKNFLVPDREGWWTIHLPDGQLMSIYDAAMRYRQEGVPVIVIGGKQYGAGSSRDWAAKGPYLLGVRAVIAESFERIHRSNLVGMGILPLQFMDGQSWKSLGLTGKEVYSIEGIGEGLRPKKTLRVRARRDDGSEVTFEVIARLDTDVEVEYYEHGGILQMVLRKLLRGRA
ncbi:MAG: aconitate hydratase AcnA [Conexivisphaera sp.]